MKMHVVLTEKDALIIAFKNALPRGKFNETVIRILRHAVRGEELKEPISFEVDLCAPEVQIEKGQLYPRNQIAYKTAYTLKLAKSFSPVLGYRTGDIRL